MNFILGDDTLEFNPIKDGYSVEFSAVTGSKRRTLSGKLIDDRIYKASFNLTGYCSTQFETLLAKLGSSFTFVDHDEKSYSVIMTSFKVSGYPIPDIGEYTLTLEEV